MDEGGTTMTAQDRLFEHLLESTVNYQRGERMAREIDAEIDRIIARSEEIAREHAQH
jgi:hypothetical protein